MSPWSPRRFAWQAWHFVTSTFTLCGRRGTWWHGLLLCVAGVPWCHLHFVWPAWYLKLGKRTLSEFRTDQFSPTYNIHVLVSADGQRLVLRAKLLYDPVYLRVPVVDDGKITPCNKQAYQEVCDAIQHASVWILTSMDWRSARRSCHVWPRELALKWIDAPCEDPAPECGHVIERKDSAHDRSEQVLCNRLQRFLRRLLSVRATLLHLPQSLGRSSMLRCDLC